MERIRWHPGGTPFRQREDRHRITPALHAQKGEEVLWRAYLSAPSHTLLQHSRDVRRIIHNVLAVSGTTPVVHTATICNLVETDAPLGTPNEKVHAQERSANCRGNDLRRRCHGRHMPLKKVQGAVETRVVSLVVVENLPLIASKHTATDGSPNDPSIPLRLFARGSRSATPPPETKPDLAPEHHDAQLQRRLETHHRLVLRLSQNPRRQHLKGQTFVRSCPLRHKGLNVLKQRLNGAFPLIGLTLREDEDALTTTQMSRLQDHVATLRIDETAHLRLNLVS
mmetsp:Transcript_22081/g.58421  ORF Transcript_22081/g.58421 Transcript_22081/m.58421 type:complete len:282 (+) Transcript_22081:574-1419(+)